MPDPDSICHSYLTANKAINWFSVNGTIQVSAQSWINLDVTVAQCANITFQLKLAPAIHILVQGMTCTQPTP